MSVNSFQIRTVTVALRRPLFDRANRTFQLSPPPSRLLPRVNFNLNIDT